MELEEVTVEVEKPTLRGGPSKASLIKANHSNAKDGDIQHFVTALKDIINLVQDIREDYALREISDNIGGEEFHPIWKEILEGNEEQVEDWIRTTKTQQGSLDKQDCIGLNALHYAIVFKKATLVKLLLEAGVGLTIPATSLRFLPLQLAVIGPEPFVEAIDLLCPTEEVDSFEVKDAFYFKKDIVNYCLDNSELGTALDLAVYRRNEKAVEILIQKGANPSHCWRGKTTLESAIERREKKIVEIMLGMENAVSNMAALKLVKCCRSDYSSEKHGHIAFNDLISAFPDLAKAVMDHCIQTRHAPHEDNYEITFDVSLFENESSNRNKCYRGLPCSCCCDVVGKGKKRHLGLESDGCFNINKSYYDSFEKEQHPLYRVMQGGDFQLLRHPIVQALLNNKLSKFFWFLYCINFTSYIALFGFLIVFILNVPNPFSQKCLAVLAGNITTKDATTENCSGVVSPAQIRLLLSFKVLALLFILVRALFEAYQLYNQKVVNYVLSWENWLEVAQCLSTTIFLFLVTGDECYCASTLEWQAGIVSLALSSLVLILWTETAPWIGIYVIIMKKIVYSFLKVAIFGLLLIIAFGLAFYMLFYRPSNAGENFGTYSNPIRAILAIIPLTAGDISIDSVFYDQQSFSTSYEALAFFIWLSCIIVMSILFNNMLVGLAVGEVKEVIDEARITEIKLKINLVLTLEENIPEFIHRSIILTKPIVVYPNISKVKTVLKGILTACCIIFSSICFNLNHMRFWRWFSYQQPSEKESIQAVKSIVEKTGLYKSEKVTSSKPVTQHEVELMMDDLKKELRL